MNSSINQTISYIYKQHQREKEENLDIPMQLTNEQIDIINSTGDIKINAVAGSGKTTTVIEYARTRPRTSKILYLAFNKSVRLEAARKFKEKGLLNVQVETAHSLAYKRVVLRSKYFVRNQGYKSHEIVELLNLEGDGQKLTEYVLANHINKFLAYFCNSDKQKVQDLNYLDVVSDGKARKFVTTFYPYIEKQTRQLLSMMESGEIDITHDFYLKKFQLKNPKLNFDYILFDEGQDASPAMLDIFFKQKATKVIVGDTHQQIYGWRYAVNSLEKADYQTFNLSTSFRFGQDNADLAMEVLTWKGIVGEYNPIPILGKGTSTELKTKAVLARTNLGLLLKAIEYVTQKKKVNHIYFEGNINSYTYADDGTSLYDVLHLYNGKHELIRDRLIKSMSDLGELEEYIEKAEELQLGMMVEIVKEYRNDIPDIIKMIKDKHVDNDEKDKAEMIFSTVHRCKGMEYDAIHLVNDFITKEKLEEIKEDRRPEEINIAKLNEEINLVYVAVTRAKNSIYIPIELIPPGHPPSPNIHILGLPKSEEIQMENIIEGFERNKKSGVTHLVPLYSETENQKDIDQPWTEELDDELTVMYCTGVTVKEMAFHFGRSKSAVKNRIKKLELQDLYG